MKTTTLTLKKPAAQPQPAQKQRIERSLVGKERAANPLAVAHHRHCRFVRRRMDCHLRHRTPLERGRVALGADRYRNLHLGAVRRHLLCRGGVMHHRHRIDELRLRARGHWPEILAAVGIDAAFLTGKNCPCPGCGGTDRFQFNRRSEAGAFSCRHHSDGGGDGFDLIRHVFECDFMRATKMVAEAIGLDAGESIHRHVVMPPPPVAPAADWMRARETAARLWHEARPIGPDDAAGRYLARRKLPLPANADALRFHPAVPYWKSGEDKPELVGTPPAMLARILRPDGMAAGLHRIYLTVDGHKFAVQRVAGQESPEGWGSGCRGCPAGHARAIACGSPRASKTPPRSWPCPAFRPGRHCRPPCCRPSGCRMRCNVSTLAPMLTRSDRAQHKLWPGACMAKVERSGFARRQVRSRIGTRRCWPGRFAMLRETQQLDALMRADYLPGIDDEATVNMVLTPESAGKRFEKPGFHFAHVSELLADHAPPVWLIDDMLEAGSLSQIFGASACGKSFQVIDWSACIATGRDWNDKATAPGAVFYIAGEGFSGFKRRVRAWEIHTGQSLADAPLFFSSQPAALMDEKNAAAVCDAVRKLQSTHGKPALIVVDTLHRNMGDGDENNASDIALFLQSLDAMRAEFGAAVLVVHHSGHAESERGRGSSSLRAAVDHEYLLKKHTDGRRELTCTKSKESEPPPAMWFNLQHVDLDWPDGKGGCAVVRRAGQCQ